MHNFNNRATLDLVALSTTSSRYLSTGIFEPLRLFSVDPVPVADPIGGDKGQLQAKLARVTSCVACGVRAVRFSGPFCRDACHSQRDLIPSMEASALASPFQLFSHSSHVMAELPTTRPSAARSLPTAASLFSTSSQGDEWEDKLNSVDKAVVVGKAEPMRRHEDEDNNQDSDDPHEGDEDVQDSEISPSRRREDRSELQQLRNENQSLVQRLALIEKQHAQSIDDLEKKLQHAIKTHKEMEQKLKLQLETVQQEQQAAVENARKVRTILTRVSSWMRQVQRSAQAERHSRHVVKPVSRDLELTVTPRSDSPYTLWSTGASLATNVSDCHESPTTTNKLDLDDDLTRSDSFGVQIDGVNEPRQATLPPPAPGRNRSKSLSLPGKGFHYVGYSLPSPCTRPAEVVLKPVGGNEIVLDGLPSVNCKPRTDTPVPKRSPGALLAYCAQVVTTSLAGVRSSPEPRAKVTPAWKGDRLPSVREELEGDEETDQCSIRASSQRPNVALPSLSIGLL